jgi:heat shock protein HtpX
MVYDGPDAPVDAIRSATGMSMAEFGIFGSVTTIILRKFIVILDGMKWPRDIGLSMRIWLTMFLLLIVYLAFLAVLRSLGVGLGWLVLISVGLAFVQYFFSDRLVLMSTGARIVGPDEYPQLHRTVERLTTEAGIPMPRLAVMPSPIPNAFATGRSPAHAVVAVTDSIHRLLTPRELEAVLAHELAHVKNRDILTMTLASFVAMIASLIMNNAIFLSLGDRRDGGSPWFVAWIVAIVVWVVSNLLLMSLSRYREFSADRGSALITRDPDALISALLKINGRISAVPGERQREAEGANAFYILPVKGSILAELFATHPPLEKRIEALERIKLEFGEGGFTR